MAEMIRNRNEIESRYKWDLTHIYPSDAAWQEDYDRISSSIAHQTSSSENQMDYAEYRIIRKDGAIRWVDDYGHYAETRNYGGIYVVFISDITDKKLQLETDTATRDAVISTLTTAYNTVYLIDDVVTEQMSLYHTESYGPG